MRDASVLPCLPHLSQHVVLLHVVYLAGVDLSFQRVLKELPADIQQQCAGGSLPQRAACWRLVVIAVGWDAITQNHTNQ